MLKTIIALIGPKRRNQMLALIPAMLSASMLEVAGLTMVVSVYAAYYGDVRERLIKDEDNRCGYHFSDEDFYIYFLAHAYKHYGAGSRAMANR